MIVELGFIYALKHPETGEIFYVGATQTSTKNRLRTHYQHLREFERGLRKTNRRYEYLVALRPLKAEITLLKIVVREDLHLIERKFIKAFKKLYSNLTNMTDGGIGTHTSKYYTEEEMKAYSAKISKANKGRKKPKGFAENLSKARMGINNPAAKPLIKNGIIAFKNNIPVGYFKYGFEINTFMKNKRAYGYVYAYINKNTTPYGFKWEYYDNCNKEIQDIVQSLYKNKE